MTTIVKLLLAFTFLTGCPRSQVVKREKAHFNLPECPTREAPQCGDGSRLVCKLLDSECPNGTIHTIVNGCYACAPTMECLICDDKSGLCEPIVICKPYDEDSELY